MFSRLRRPASVALLTLCLTSLLVTVPMGAPASADVDAPPRPLTVPGSAYQSSTQPTGNGSWFNQGITGRLNTYVSNVGPGILTKRSVPYMVMQATNQVYTFATGNGAAEMRAQDPLKWAACTITGGIATDQCGEPLKLGGQIIPNEGYAAGQPGWREGKHSFATAEGLWTASLKNMPAFGGRATSDSLITVRLEYTGSYCTGTTSERDRGSVNIGGWSYTATENPQWRTNHVGYSSGLSCPRDPAQYPNDSVKESITPTIPLSRYGFDHLTITMGGNGHQNAVTGTPLLAWFPEGHSLRPPDPVSNPRRSFHTSWKCSDGGEGAGVSAWFTETDSSLPAPKEARCINGEVVEYTISLVTEGSVDREIMYEWKAEQSYLDYLRDWEGNPDKDADLDLGFIGAGGQVVSCFSDPSKCTDWFDRPDKQDTMKCSKGSTQLPLSDCNPYRPTFDPQKTAQGQVYADPRDAALPDPKPAPSTPAPAPSGNACFPSGWNVFNPVEWVLKPVSCALEWAFVPKVSLQTRVGNLQDQATQNGILGVLGSGAGFITAVPYLPNSCPDWTIKVAGEETNVVCDSSFTHALVAGRPVIAFFMIATAISPLLRSLWYSVFPILKPVPSGA